jgi:hypothetical protein
MKEGLLALLFLLTAFSSVHAQKKKPVSNMRRTDMALTQFIEKQWWLGIKSGTTLSGINVLQGFSGFSPINYQSSPKKYENYRQAGFAALFDIAFTYRHLGVSFTPGYRNARFAYQTSYTWTDMLNPDIRLDLNNTHEHRIEYVDLPLSVRYDITATRLRPYVQLGTYYALLVQAFKTLRSTGNDYASGGISAFSFAPVNQTVTSQFAPRHWGLLAGAGLHYQAGNIRFNLDLQYRHGMSLVNSTRNRYDNVSFSGLGEVMDDVKLHALLIQAGVLFPMKFLSRDYRSSLSR